MRVLIVSKYYYPQNTPRSFRTTELVREFIRRKHEVTLALPVDATKHIVEPQVKVLDLGGLEMIRFFKRVNSMPYFGRYIQRILDLFFHLPDLILALQLWRRKGIFGEYDLVISIAVPHSIHWGVSYVRWSNNNLAKTWIADCGDPFMGDRTDSFRKLFYFKYLENFFCKSADFISVPTENSKHGYDTQFADKIVVIPQGFEFKSHRSANNKLYNEITFGYAGRFIPNIRDPRSFLDYLVSLDLPYKFIIYTRQSKTIDQYVHRSGGRIVTRDYIERNDLLKELSKMHFLINFENLEGVQSPSKIIDYSLTGRPILSISTPDSFRSFERFYQGDYSKQLKLDNLHDYNITNVVSKFIELTR